jgi:hypothetical protein
MTEAEWLACDDPGPMLHRLGAGVGERKSRLFLCALYRRAWHLLDGEGRRAVEVAERLADGLAGEAERLAAREPAAGYEVLILNSPKFMSIEASQAVLSPSVGGDPDSCGGRAARAGFGIAAAAIPVPEGGGRDPFGSWKRTVAPLLRDEGKGQADLVRDLFRNPFRPAPAVDPAWLAWDGGRVRKLAEAIYDGRAFDRLPALADALEEAGCSDAELLGHLREPGPHVRGCWAVDLLLGKE